LTRVVGLDEGSRVSTPNLDIDPQLERACSAILSEIRRHLGGREGTRPVVIALDGASGSGKSTLAAMVAAELDAVIVPGDDFFAAQITDAEWDLLDAAERARAVIDWRRLRREALEPLIAGRTASWHPFDFEAGTRPDGSYPMSTETTVRQPASVIVLDVAYSCRPELADLIDVSVLVDVPATERRRRLASRDEKAFSDAWHTRWDAAEDYYFTRIRPASSFDLVVAVHPAAARGRQARSVRVSSGSRSNSPGSTAR
jgi:uridine kinase